MEASMSAEQSAINITGVGAMVALSGIDRRLVQRIKSGAIVPHQATAEKIAKARATYLRQKLTRRVEA
jgi:hypothetical protein